MIMFSSQNIAHAYFPDVHQRWNESHDGDGQEKKHEKGHGVVGRIHNHSKHYRKSNRFRFQ